MSGQSRRDVLYDRGGNYAVIRPRGQLADPLRDLGWRGETVVIVTEREPDDAISAMAAEFAELRADVFVPRVGARVVSADGVLETRDAAGAAANLWDRYESWPLRAAVGVPAWFAQDRGQIRPAPGPSLIGFRDSAGFASMGAADFLEHGHLLESQGEPRLFDLRLRRDGRNLGLADHQGRFLPLSAELRRLLPDLPPDADEVRLMVDDGAEVMAAAAALATALWRPVWVTPGGAEVVRSAGDRLMARDRRSGQGVAWVQVMPEGWQAPVPPWYDTTSGMFEAPPGNAVALRLQRGPDDAACGALMARHEDYSEFAEVARRIQVSAGVFLVRLEIHSQDRVFSLDGLALIR